jgi:hypothetical protein
MVRYRRREASLTAVSKEPTLHIPNHGGFVLDILQSSYDSAELGWISSRSLGADEEALLTGCLERLAAKDRAPRFLVWSICLR